MATRTFTSNRARDRLVISTILTHLVAFHEAGFEYSIERRRRVKFEIWNPFTWMGGYEWIKSNEAMAPRIQEFVFIVGADARRDPAEFAVSQTPSTGYFKASSVYVGTGPAESGWDARSVTDVIIRFAYNGETRTLRHSDG